MTPPSKFQIGTTLGGMVDLSTIVARYQPFQSPQLYYDQIELGDKTERGIGFPTTKWHWDILPESARTTLKTTYCADPAISAVVYINTPDNSGAWHSYQAVLKWPLPEIMGNQRRFAFDLIFERLILQV
jgi:hypothetical protein